MKWKRARVVESGSLENCYTRKGIGGSNPPASANFQNSDFGRLLPRPRYARTRLPPRF